MNSNDVVLAIVVGTLAMLLMAGAVILFVLINQKRKIQEKIRYQSLELEHQQKVLLAAMESQESERQRVSRDLHDDVGMMVMTIRAQINSMSGMVLSEEVLVGIRQLVDETHETIRRIAWDLMPGTLQRFGLSQTLKEMCQRISVNRSVPVEFVETGEILSLTKNQETVLYRLAQELVSNAVRHAKASLIRISLDWHVEGLSLVAADNGIGFEIPVTNHRPHGLGLLNVESRVSLLGGQLYTRRNVPSGTIIEINLSLNGRH